MRQKQTQKLDRTTVVVGDMIWLRQTIKFAVKKKVQFQTSKSAYQSSDVYIVTKSALSLVHHFASTLMINILLFLLFGRFLNEAQHISIACTYTREVTWVKDKIKKKNASNSRLAPRKLNL